MKDDTISRAAALDALGEEPPVWYDGEDEIAERNQWRRDVAAIKALPSATDTNVGGNLIDRQAALDAIKKLEKPAPTAQHLSAIFDCEDTIKALPSAQPVNITKLQPNCNQVASDCASDCASHCASDCISRQAAISICDNAIDLWNGQLGTGALVAVRDVIMALPSAQPGWIPCSERCPEHRVYVLVTYKPVYGIPDIGIAWYSKSEGKWNTSREVLAWMSLPTPYREGGQDGD